MALFVHPTSKSTCIQCTKPVQVTESAAPVLAEETAKIYSIPDEEVCKEPR